MPSKSLPQIAREIHDLATRARAGKLKPDDLTEGTYTISNNGAFGTVITAPIIGMALGAYAAHVDYMRDRMQIGRAHV